MIKDTYNLNGSLDDALLDIAAYQTALKLHYMKYMSDLTGFPQKEILAEIEDLAKKQKHVFKRELKKLDDEAR